jgi:tetratricopeptide (TPR) repeat protein
VASCRDDGDVRGLAEGLLNRAVMQSQAGDPAAAVASASEAETLARRIADAGFLARVLVVRSMALAGGGDWGAVERSAREAELTARAAATGAQLALALGMIGTARREQGDLAGCRAAHVDELSVATAAADPQAIAVARTNLGNVAIAEQRYDEALEHYAAAEPTFRRLHVVSSLLPLLANRAQVHHALGRGPAAAADYAGAADAAATLGAWAAVRQWGEPGIQLAHQVGDVASAESLWSSLAAAARAGSDDAELQRALGERALLLIQRAQPAGVPGDATNTDATLLDAAAALLDEQEVICRRIGDATGLAACIGNRAIVLRYRGDLAGSLACLDEQLDIARQSGNGQGVLFATANRGEVLGLLGRVPEALESLAGARSTAAQYGLAPMVQQLDSMIAALRARN